MEVSMKVFALGLPRFWRSNLNKIDIIAIIASFLFLVIDGPKCGLKVIDQTSFNELSTLLKFLFFESHFFINFFR